MGCELERDLKAAFPDMQGFSPRNFKYMRALALAWPTPAIVQQAVAQLPWSHIVTLLDKLKEPGARNWYAAQSLEHGWSRNVLAMQIDTHAYSRAGAGSSGFALHLLTSMPQRCKRQVPMTPLHCCRSNCALRSISCRTTNASCCCW